MGFGLTVLDSSRDLISSSDICGLEFNDDNEMRVHRVDHSTARHMGFILLDDFRRLWEVRLDRIVSGSCIVTL